MNDNTNDTGNPVLTFEGKKYLINDLSSDIKESIKGLQIAETQLKMHEDTLKLLKISRNTLANQLREKLKSVLKRVSVNFFTLQGFDSFYGSLSSWNSCKGWYIVFYCGTS